MRRWYVDRDNSVLTCQARCLYSPHDQQPGARVSSERHPNVPPSFLLAPLFYERCNFDGKSNSLHSKALLFRRLAARILVLSFRSFQFDLVFVHFRLLCVDLKRETWTWSQRRTGFFTLALRVSMLFSNVFGTERWWLQSNATWRLARL